VEDDDEDVEVVVAKLAAYEAPVERCIVTVAVPLPVVVETPESPVTWKGLLYWKTLLFLLEVRAKP